MPKLSLKANPTFTATVDIPVAGAEAVPVLFTFKHRTRDELREWLGTERDDPTAVVDMAVGWDLVEPLNLETAEILVQNYNGAAREILDKYLDELTQARRKN
jgi:hypothetical protein